MRRCVLLFGLVALAACSSPKDEPSKAPLPTGPGAPATTGTEKRPDAAETFRWVAEGDFGLVTGALTTGGHSRTGINAGETLMAFLKLRGLAVGEPLDGRITVTGPEGIVFEQSSILLKGDQVRRATGIVALSTGTLSSWVSGAYTLNLEITQRAASRKGRFYIPFALRGLPMPRSTVFSVARTHLPEFARGTGTITAWTLLARPGFRKGGQGMQAEVDVSYSYREATHGGKALEQPRGTLPFVRWTGTGPRAYLWGHADLPAPKAPGVYLLRLEFHDKVSGKRVITGENLKIAAADGGLFNLSLEDSAGIPRQVWRRSDQGRVSLSVSGLSGDKATLDIAVLGPRGGAYLIQKNNPLSLRMGAGQFRLPFTVPEFVPRGRFKIHLRLRTGTKELERVLRLTVDGPKLELSNQMRVHGLELTQDLSAFLSREVPPLRTGRKVLYTFIVRGFTHGRFKQRFEQLHKEVELLKIGLTCSLSLTRPLDTEPLQREDLVKIDRTVFNGINIVRMAGEFTIRPLPPGRYIVRVDCADKYSTAATQMMRQVTLVR